MGDARRVLHRRFGGIEDVCSADVRHTALLFEVFAFRHSVAWLLACRRLRDALGALAQHLIVRWAPAQQPLHSVVRRCDRCVRTRG